jgi:outer membrane receptor for ferrienterochelin and colicins
MKTSIFTVNSYTTEAQHPLFKKETAMSNLNFTFVQAVCRMMIFCIVVLVGIGIESASAQETGRITGKVKDEQTGDPLPQANVVVASLEREMSPRGVATNNSGEFEIRGLTAGRYRVTISFVGYGTYVGEVQVAAAGTATMNVTLKPGINVNPIVVSASRRPEKALEAPASISVVDARQIVGQPTLSAAEHLVGLPGVDVTNNGIAQKNVVIRGFNNIFSGTLLALTDYRIAHVPSLRVNIYNFYPQTNEDIDRIEAVSGPASALYGPNSANGVFHTITKSPLGSEGTVVGLGGGERSVLMSSVRHAGSFNERLGYKISLQYYKAEDWKGYDTADVNPRVITLGTQTPTGRIAKGGPILNTPDFGVTKLAGEARVDYLISDDARLVFTSGLNQASNIELTGIGAGQAKDWTYTYVQTRFTYKDLFVQGFVNASDAGDTYIMRTGNLIVDNSKMYVGQVQHSYVLNDKQRFTYGLDALLTRPDTKGTINGNNENDDNIDQFGGYVQSETNLTPQWSFIAAARYDIHSELDDPAISPRAAVVFKPNANHNFRVTFNRAFNTPSTNNLFLDIVGATDAFGFGALSPLFGGTKTGIDIRAQGVPNTGFSFSRSGNGLPQFRSPFAVAFGPGNSASSYYDLDNPAFTNVVWSITRGSVKQGFATKLVGTPLASQIPAITRNLDNVTTPGYGNVAGVKNVMRTLNPDTRQFTQVSNVTDIGQMKPEITQTIELGYKGVLMEKLLLGVDVYRTSVKDFVGPLIMETPSVFVDPATGQAVLAGQLQSYIVNRLTTSPQIADTLGFLDSPLFGGNGNGTIVDELMNTYLTAMFSIPYGTVSPKEAYDPTAMILTYRNFGDITLWGADFHATYYMNRNWTFSGSYSYVSEDLFPAKGTQPHDIALNAPQHKHSVTARYLSDDEVIDASIRMRYTAGFPVRTGVYIGRVSSYRLFDLNVGYMLPWVRGTRLTLSAQNIFDNVHREMMGAPMIGRLVLVRATYTL